MEKSEILRGAKEKALNLQDEICKLLVGEGLSFRQAEAILDMAKERLKDVRI